jgi:transposase
VITPGEAVAGMILKGLGFANRPLSLTPQFFASTPLDLLFREGLRAEMFNRFQLGRTLDEIYADGCDLLLQELALAVCAQEGIDRRFHHLDTTSCSLSGDDVPDSDEHAMTITHGYSKDQRPDVKQAVLELLGSQDGGVPCVRKSWDGHPSDTQIFQERAQALMTAVQHAPGPPYLMADSTLDHEAKAANLHKLGFITRMPHTIGVVAQVITPALTWDTWQRLDDTTRDQRLEWCHAGIAQRWLVVSAQAALERAEATLTKARQREDEAIDKPLLHLHATRFPTPEAAQEALAALATGWRDHQVAVSHLSAHTRDAGQGRPTPHTPRQASAWDIQAQARSDDAAIARLQHGKACFVLGSHIDASQLSDPEVIHAYKGQSHVEGGVRFLKDPLLFVSSVFVKKPCRIQGLLMVMTLALLVYSVAQRRLRRR